MSELALAHVYNEALTIIRRHSLLDPLLIFIEEQNYQIRHTFR